MSYREEIAIFSQKAAENFLRGLPFCALVIIVARSFPTRCTKVPICGNQRAAELVQSAIG